MTATQSLRLYDLFLKHFKNDADAKAFVNELEIVLGEKSNKDDRTYSNKRNRINKKRFPDFKTGSESWPC